MFSHELLTLCKEDVKDFKDEEPAKQQGLGTKTLPSVRQINCFIFI